MADRFFTHEHLQPGEFTLEGAEAHHISQVRRLTSGDRIVLFNGDGREYEAEILALKKRSIEVQINAITDVSRELPFELTVASALPKGERLDFLVEKLTELGVTRFVPLECTRSVVRLKEGREDRLERAVIEASKQCGRNRLMTVSVSQPWSLFVSQPALPSHKWIMHPSTSDRHFVRESVADALVIAIGPEGGFTESEIEAAIRCGWNLASMGPRILRIETAAIAAVATMVNQ